MQYLGMTNNHVKFVNLKEYNSWLDNLYLSQNEYKYLTHTYCIQIYYFIILSKIVSIFLQLTRNSKNLQNCDDDDDYWNSMVWKLSFCRFSLNASSRKERERALVLVVTQVDKSKKTALFKDSIKCLFGHKLKLAVAPT